MQLETISQLHTLRSYFMRKLKKNIRLEMSNAHENDNQAFRAGP